MTVANGLAQACRLLRASTSPLYVRVERATLPLHPAVRQDLSRAVADGADAHLDSVHHDQISTVDTYGGLRQPPEELISQALHPPYSGGRPQANGVGKPFPVPVSGWPPGGFSVGSVALWSAGLSKIRNLTAQRSRRLLASASIQPPSAFIGARASRRIRPE